MAQRILHILSGGAAQGLVHRLQPGFEATHGCRLECAFGAVGLMKDKLLSGAPCDLLILTHALIAELAGQGHAVGPSARPLGLVKTGVAVKTGAPALDVASPEALRQALEQAGGVYFPDPTKATAGIHFMKVLTGLGVADKLASRLRTFPNGATAMAALAGAGRRRLHAGDGDPVHAGRDAERPAAAALRAGDHLHGRCHGARRRAGAGRRTDRGADCR
jgi:molybdate transport system substrate-binding protein